MGVIGFLIVLFMLQGVVALLFEPGGLRRVAILGFWAVLIPMILATLVSRVLG
jgi:hypothetical protein